VFFSSEYAVCVVIVVLVAVVIDEYGFVFV
jgi:hypothetical protein